MQKMEKEVKAGLDVDSLRIRKFEVGDLVFAKLKGYPPWPSKINQIESIISGGKEKIRYNVYFYGTHQSSILRSSSLYHYDTYAKSIVDKWGRRPKFHDALKELEREMMDKITYLHQLRTTTPDSTWCPGFSTACEGLVNDIDGGNVKTKSKSHRKQKQLAEKSTDASTDEIHEIDDDSEDESKKVGYEVKYMEKIPFPDAPESLVILSLRFDENWVKMESARLKEEERMMNCHVRIGPLPQKYAHLEPKNGSQSAPQKYAHLESKNGSQSATQKYAHLETKNGNQSAQIKDEDEDEDDVSLAYRSSLLKPRTAEKGYNSSRSRSPKAAPKTQWKADKRKLSSMEEQESSRPFVREASDGSDSEGAVETCPICRLCFFSKTELKDHEVSVHGIIPTAESLFDRLMNSSENESISKPQTSSLEANLPKKSNSTYLVKEGYPLDSQIS